MTDTTTTGAVTGDTDVTDTSGADSSSTGETTDTTTATTGVVATGSTATTATTTKKATTTSRYTGTTAVRNEEALKQLDFVVEVEPGRDIRVLQLSDTQMMDVKDAEERCFKYIRRAVERTNPDLIIITGDLVYGKFDDDGSILTALRLCVRNGVFGEWMRQSNLKEVG